MFIIIDKYINASKKFSDLTISLKIDKLEELIEKENFVSIILNKANKLEVGDYLDIRSYKRNRSVVIVRLSFGFRLIENGHRRLDITLKPEDLKKTLKTIERAEFPNSHKIRAFTLNNFSDDKLSIKRKKI